MSELIKNKVYRNTPNWFIKLLFFPNLFFSELWDSENRKIYIKISAPNWAEARKWGDLLFALNLKKQLDLKGYFCIIHCRNEWKNKHDGKPIVISIRGLHQYKPRKNDTNLLWNISHPELISDEEYAWYDEIFIASNRKAAELKFRLNREIKYLPQCTDPLSFYPLGLKVRYDLLFIGNTRNIFRDVVKKIIKTDFHFKVIGMGWSQFIDPKYILSPYVTHKHLNKYYNRTRILLNDHWEDMKEQGFVSNRIYDALASGCIVISDKPNCDLSEFEGCKNIYFYESASELITAINKALSSNIVRESTVIHTFKEAAEQIHLVAKSI